MPLRYLVETNIVIFDGHSYTQDTWISNKKKLNLCKVKVAIQNIKHFLIINFMLVNR